MPNNSRIVGFITSGTPWAIEAEALRTIIGIAQRENNLEAVLKERGAPMDNSHKVEIRNGIALIPVTGPLFPRANLFGQISGAYSVEMLAQDLSATESNPNIKGAVLVIDSPGGHTTMINEFANQVADYSKPIVAYVVGQAASAAYWIASAADKIVMDSSALVGSIGVVAAFDAKDSGTIEIVSSHAPDKRPDIATDGGRAVIQTIVDDMEAVFIDSVARFRGLSRDQITALRGSVAVGAKAVSMGFADEIGSLESVINFLTQQENPMDLHQLKADHKELYQAAFAEGAASVDSKAIRATEIGRISAILNHEHAAGREEQAKVLALKTDMSVEQAAEVLAVSPKAETQAAGDQFSQHMAKLGNPKVGADDADEADQSSAETAAQGWGNAFAKVSVINGGKR
ncbi:MAG: S49 family peptidase [Methylobacter sp.]